MKGLKRRIYSGNRDSYRVILVQLPPSSRCCAIFASLDKDALRKLFNKQQINWKEVKKQPESLEIGNS